MQPPIQECLSRLEKEGVLLKADSRLASVATLVAMEPIRGSWWAHPAAETILKTIQQLAARPDVVLTKLIGGKDTFVHKQLWPELLSIATSKQAWQLEHLSSSAKRMYKDVEEKGEVEAAGPDAKALESRLLVRGEQFHSDTGNHKKRLESWHRWAERVGINESDIPEVSESKRILESRYPGAKWPWKERK